MIEPNEKYRKEIDFFSKAACAASWVTGYMAAISENPTSFDKGELEAALSDRVNADNPTRPISTLLTEDVVKSLNLISTNIGNAEVEEIIGEVAPFAIAAIASAWIKGRGSQDVGKATEQTADLTTLFLGDISEILRDPPGSRKDNLHKALRSLILPANMAAGEMK